MVKHHFGISPAYCQLARGGAALSQHSRHVCAPVSVYFRNEWIALSHIFGCLTDRPEIDYSMETPMQLCLAVAAETPPRRYES
jgi:hypothetical protein